jgi:hypothetical protein
VEAVVEQNRVEIEAGAAAKELEHARARLDAYLRACRFPDAAREQLASEIMMGIEDRFESDPHAEANSIAMDEAFKAVRSRLAGEIPPLTPNRAPETHPMTMETSLTRLPSFRIVAGWFLLVVLIVFAFILTR